MERGESPQNRARVVIVSQRPRAGATRSTSSTTLSLMPRWSSDRAADMAARTPKREREATPPAIPQA